MSVCISKEFKQFVEDLLPQLIPFNETNPNSVVILDNCAIHLTPLSHGLLNPDSIRVESGLACAHLGSNPDSSGLKFGLQPCWWNGFDPHYPGYKRVKNGSGRTDIDRRRSGGTFGRVVGCSCSVEWYCVRAVASMEQVVTRSPNTQSWCDLCENLL